MHMVTVTPCSTHCHFWKFQIDTDFLAEISMTIGSYMHGCYNIHDHKQCGLLIIIKQYPDKIRTFNRFIKDKSLGA